MTQTRNINTDGRTVEITYISIVDLDAPAPGAAQHWDGALGRWTADQYGLADYAETTHHTLRGTHTERWYKRHHDASVFASRIPQAWRSADGGTPAPAGLSSGLDDALSLARRS